MKQLTIPMFGGDSPTPEKAYFNTTKLRKEKLIEANTAALDQERYILDIFKKHSPMSPSDVWRVYERSRGSSILLTSVRRSITNLTDKGFLVKTAIRKPGIYKRPEYVWKIQSQEPV